MDRETRAKLHQAVMDAVTIVQYGCPVERCAMLPGVDVDEVDRNCNCASALAKCLRDATKYMTGMLDKPNVRVVYDPVRSEIGGLTEGDMRKWREAYPALDVKQEIGRAAMWLAANPARRKKNVYRYLNNWLSRAQERGGGGAVATHSPWGGRPRWGGGVGGAVPPKPSAAMIREEALIKAVTQLEGVWADEQVRAETMSRQERELASFGSNADGITLAQEVVAVAQYRLSRREAGLAMPNFADIMGGNRKGR